MTMLFVDGAEGSDDTITAFQWNHQEILRQVAEYFVPLPVKFGFQGRIIDYGGLSGLDNPARNELIHGKAGLLDAFLCCAVIIGCPRNEEFVLFLVPQDHNGSLGTGESFDFTVDIIQQFLQIRVFGQGHADPEDGLVLTGKAVFLCHIT